MNIPQYFRLWLACARYSVVRSMMFRFDFLMWALVELFWMGVNVALVSVIYRHTSEIGGWTKYQMLLLIGTSMMIQRLLMGFFWSNLFEMGRNVRSGNFDFFLAQPGNVLFMVSTRKIDLDSLANVIVAAGLVVYSAQQCHLTPSFSQIVLYLGLLLCGLVIHYSLILMVVSMTFWIVKTEGIEGSYFTLTEFSRLPREVFKGLINVVFVYALPVVVVSNVPATVLLNKGFQPIHVLWVCSVAVVWVAIAIFIFHRGLRRYSSASS
jgi:ABC-2 type transport system permease protein